MQGSGTDLKLDVVKEPDVLTVPPELLARFGKDLEFLSLCDAIGGWQKVN